MLAFISWGVNSEFELRRKAVANSESQENSGFISVTVQVVCTGNYF